MPVFGRSGSAFEMDSPLIFFLALVQLALEVLQVLIQASDFSGKQRFLDFC